MSADDGLLDLDVELWVRKAEQDRGAALALADIAYWDAVCFHAQQCAEKYLKAFIVAQWVVPRKTHNLLELAAEVYALRVDLPDLSDALSVLNPYSVDIRYPGPSANEAAANDAIAAMERARVVLRAALGLADDCEDASAETP